VTLAAALVRAREYGFADGTFGPSPTATRTARLSSEVRTMADLTLQCAVDHGTTVLTVAGAVEAHRCWSLRDGLEMALSLRPKGPIVVDLARVDWLAAAAVLILRRAADDARRAGRSLTVRHLRQETIRDPRSVQLCRDLWADPAGGSTPEVLRRRPAAVRATAH